MKRSEVVKTTVGLPKGNGRYQLRVNEAKFKVSEAGGNPMITLDCEVCGRDGATQVTDIDGTVCEIAGVKATALIMLTDKGMNDVFELFDRLGHTVDEIDRENPDISWLKDVVIEALLNSGDNIVYGSDRKPILDAEGKPVIRGQKVNPVWPRDILGLSKHDYSSKQY